MPRYESKKKERAAREREALAARLGRERNLAGKIRNARLYPIAVRSGVFSRVSARKVRPGEDGDFSCICLLAMVWVEWFHPAAGVQPRVFVVWS